MESNHPESSLRVRCNPTTATTAGLRGHESNVQSATGNNRAGLPHAYLGKWRRFGDAASAYTQETRRARGPSTVTLRFHCQRTGDTRARRAHVSRLGFGTRIRTWIARFRVSRPTSWTIPKLRRSGGNCTRAARSKSPACRFNTTDRRVGPEGVKPSPHRLKAGHASLHFDPVLLSLRSTFSFALHGHTSNHRFTIVGHTSPVERTRALRTRIALSEHSPFTHLSCGPVWSRTN